MAENEILQQINTSPNPKLVNFSKYDQLLWRKRLVPTILGIWGQKEVLL
jgi:hypothetical protein